MKRFVVGDIHGAHKALLQCLERSKFDRSKDLLVSLGDICDGWPEVDKVLDELLGVKHLEVILGNHDAWALQWMTHGWTGPEWVGQGGEATLRSYQSDRKLVPAPHAALLKRAVLFLELDKKLFVHGGFDPSMEIDGQDPQLLMWDRRLLLSAVETAKKIPGHRYGKWEDIFVGHTTTQVFMTDKPVHACNVWDLDTGCGWRGPLTLMDIDSHRFWQSDPAGELYPDLKGRR